MSSVPHIHGEVKLNTLETSFLDFDIEPDLRKIRHVRSIIIKRIRSPHNTNSFETDMIVSEYNNFARSHTLELNMEHAKNLAGSRSIDGHPTNRLLKLKAKSSFSLKNIPNRPTTASGDIGNYKDDKIVTTMMKVGDIIQSKTSVNSSTTNGFNVSSSDQVQRQLSMQDINKEAFFSCFYTVSDFLNVDKPYFISRIFPSHTDLEDEIELPLYKKSCTINLFIRISDMNWKLLCQYHIKLSFLINIGENLKLIDSQFKDINNLLIFKFTDDCYYILPNDSMSSDVLIKLRSRHVNKVIERLRSFRHRELTCSYDQIMKLNNLSICNYDLTQSRQELTSKIMLILSKSSTHHYSIHEIKRLEVCVTHLQENLIEQKSHNHYITAKIEQLKMQKLKLQLILPSLEYPPPGKSLALSEISTELSTLSLSISHNIGLINQEKSRVSNILQFIFPILPVPNKHDFSLFKMRFPSVLITPANISQVISRISKTHMDELNSLIGYISLIILTLAKILDVPLRYRIRYLGSNTYIHDPISDLRGSNSSDNKGCAIYPLFMVQNKTLAVKFSYALLLLRKDLEQLFELEGLVKVEEFNMLVNCKIWLTCVSGYSDTVDFEERGRGNLENRGNIRGQSKASRVSRGSKGSKGLEDMNEFLISEERISHIKRHLLKSNGNEVNV